MENSSGKKYEKPVTIQLGQAPVGQGVCSLGSGATTNGCTPGNNAGGTTSNSCYNGFTPAYKCATGTGASGAGCRNGLTPLICALGGSK